MSNLSHPCAQREPSAAAVFVAALPDHHRGRIVTASSVIDCHKHKPLAVVERLTRERIAGVRS